MMDSKKIGLEDKDLVDDYLKMYPQKISELSFSNLFVWRNSKDINIAELDGHLIISLNNDKKISFYQPIGPEPAEMIKKLLRLYPGSVFERVEKEIAIQLKDDFDVEEDRDMFDYVYLLDNLRELKGGDYVEKRNFIRQCERYQPKICMLDENSVDQFRKLQEKWYGMKDTDDPGLKAENDAVMQCLEHFKRLDLFGVCVHIDEKIVGFAIAEKLNDDTFVEHFEKGNPKYKGIYQYVLYVLSEKIPKEYKYLNREQDLGIQGLRKAKMSYSPEFLIEKYKISQRL